MHKVMYGVSDAAFRRTLDDLAELLEVGPLLRIQTRRLSLGERMKMELITALIHSPDLLFLDEPTLGLDVVSQQRVRDFLRRLNREKGTTILLTSHYMADIESLCPRVLLIDHGRLHFDGPLPGLLRRTTSHKLIRAVYREPLDRSAVEAALAGLDLSPPADELTVGLSAPREAVASVAERLLRLGQLIDLTVEDPPIEDVIRSIFGSRESGLSGPASRTGAEAVR
jgi:ABC-2 type transport system ATP-binding protein